MNFNLFGPSCLWYSNRLSRRTDSTHRAPRQSVWNLKDFYGNITSFVFKAKYRGNVDIFLQNKRKLTSIVVICRPCSRKWWILANIGDFEGLAFGVYLSVTRERQGRRSSQNRSSTKPKFKRSRRLLHSDWIQLISDMSNNEQTAWPFEVGTRKFAMDHLSHICVLFGGWHLVICRIFKRMVRAESLTSQLCLELGSEAGQCEFRGKFWLGAGAVLRRSPPLSFSYYAQVNAKR